MTAITVGSRWQSTIAPEGVVTVTHTQPLTRGRRIIFYRWAGSSTVGESSEAMFLLTFAPEGSL